MCAGCTVDAQDPVIPDAWRHGEVAVIGIARSGSAMSRWLAGRGVAVYASDVASTAATVATAEQLRALGVAVEIGAHDVERVARAAAVIVSPGVPPDAPPVVAARAAGVAIRSELDVAAAALAAAKLIVVTGTNGKSTTTAIIAHLLRASGIRAEAAGNIGRPLIELAGEMQQPEWIAVEASSFQLHDSPLLDPAVGVLTNLSPDHLDRYASVEEYYADKRLLFRNASSRSVWILNGDDSAVLELAGDSVGTRRLWRLSAPADAWYDRTTERLMLEDTVLLARRELPLLGEHNIENALAAALAARSAGVATEAIGQALTAFSPLPHRLEPVRDLDGVLWINDSKATNLASTVKAARAMLRPFVLLLGGRHKGQPYTAIAPVLVGRCRGVVAFGEAAPLVERDLGDQVPVTAVDALDDAVVRSRALARSGDVVLLSPACASFDAFTDYEERGERFRALVLSL